MFHKRFARLYSSTRLLVRCIGVVLIAVALLISTPVSHAQDPVPTTPTSPAQAPDEPTAPEGAVVVPMVAACDEISGDVLQTAIDLDLCPDPNADVSPMGYAYGDCGVTWVFISDVGLGVADFEIGASSSIGTMAELDYSLSWTNWHTSTTGGKSGLVFPFSTSWNKSFAEYTAAGYVSASMSGHTIHTNGIPCTFNIPTASAGITW